MERIQIQLPTPLAQQLRGIAGFLDISFAELRRRGLEFMRNFEELINPVA